MSEDRMPGHSKPNKYRDKGEEKQLGTSWVPSFSCDSLGGTRVNFLINGHQMFLVCNRQGEGHSCPGRNYTRANVNKCTVKVKATCFMKDRVRPE